jgi:hypothetical protein
MAMATEGLIADGYADPMSLIASSEAPFFSALTSGV